MVWYTISMNPIKSTAKDIFVYLGIFITLVDSVYNIIQIVFSAIDIKWKDVATLATNYDIYNDSVRFAVASLLVMYPLYVLFSFLASKEITLHPAKKEVLTRKIFVYSALFVTTLTLAGTLISIIYTYLGGDLSIRFGMKALFIVVLSSVIGGYYYYNLKRDYTKDNKVPLTVALVTSLFVLALVIWSITIIGTPSEVRKMKIDSTRLEHLSNIQQQILYTFQTKGTLPTTIIEMQNALQGFVVPVDPVTGVNYEYTIVQQGRVGYDDYTRTKVLITPAKFVLCATFDTKRFYNQNGIKVTNATDIGGTGLETKATYQAYYMGDTTPFWNHDATRTCFTRTITPDMYIGGKGM